MSDKRDIDEVIICNVSALSFLRSFISFLRGEFSVSTELLGYSSLDIPHASAPPQALSADYHNFMRISRHQSK